MSIDLKKKKNKFKFMYCPKNHIKDICQKCQSDNCCIHCQTKLVLKKDTFKFTKKQLIDFKEQFGYDLHIPQGYRCPKCGACYNKDYERQPINIQLG